MTSLLFTLRSHRFVAPALASFALALAGCGGDTTSSEREPTTGSSSHASGKKDAGNRASDSEEEEDAGKSATHSSAEDAGKSTSHSSSADASAAHNGGGSSTSTSEDGGSGYSQQDDGGAQGGSGAYEWPSDCETHYTFVAHNANGVHDTSKRQVAAGSQYYSSYYYRAPWGNGEVQGLKFRSIIDNAKIVHHWIIYGVDSGTEQDGSVQGGEGEPIGSMQGEFYIAGWAPGALDIEMPDGVGLHMPSGPNAMFRLEVHYFNTAPGAVAEQDASGVEFCVTSHKRANEAAIHWMGTTNIFVPAHQTADVNSTCVPKITNGPVHLIGLSAHMHKTGVHARAILNRGNGGSPVSLIDDAFSFNDQRGYKEPRDGSAPDVLINAGDTINVTCSYDNTTDQAKTFGANTENEMCLFYAMAWPRGQLSNGSFTIVAGAEPEVNCIQ